MKATCIVSVRVSVETRDKWREIAKAKGLSVGKMLQEAVLSRQPENLTKTTNIFIPGNIVNPGPDDVQFPTTGVNEQKIKVTSKTERPFKPFTKADQLGRKK